MKNKLQNIWKRIKEYFAYIIIKATVIDRQETIIYNIGADKKYNVAYSDLNGKTLYLVKAKDDMEKISNCKAVLKTFGHLSYFFKTKLSTGVKKKISTNTYKEAYEVLKKKTFQDTASTRDETKGLEELDSLLDNDKF